MENQITRDPVRLDWVAAAVGADCGNIVQNTRLAFCFSPSPSDVLKCGSVVVITSLGPQFPHCYSAIIRVINNDVNNATL